MKANAMREDLLPMIEVLKAIRYCLNLPAEGTAV
jgi:hypothetical protein